MCCLAYQRQRDVSGLFTQAIPRPPRFLSLLLGVLLLLCGTACPASAATRNPAIVAHIGDAIPITLYMRVKRQITTSFFFGTADPQQQQLQIEEDTVVEDKEGNVVVMENDVTATPDELRLADLQLPSFGATTGKHQNQLVRNLPPTYSPRFGINRAVTLIANGTLRAAGKSLAEDATLQQSELAVRFSVGRGLNKESTWLPLASRHAFVDLLTDMLRRRVNAMRDAEAGNDNIAAERAELEEQLVALGGDRDKPEIQYLSRVTFYFGFQTGELQKITSFNIDATYSPVVKPGIELHYVWSEHRAYNPNRALVLCSAASLAVAMVMIVVVFHPSSRSMLLFSQRIVAVREHE